VKHQAGVRIETVCGPEDLNGIELARRISKQYRALPLPLWWPVVALSLKLLHKIGFAIVKPDQLTRLIGKKTGTAGSATNTPKWARSFPEPAKQAKEGSPGRKPQDHC
jgi:hypothetical protein